MRAAVRGAQEPAGRRRYPRKVIILAGWLGLRLRLGLGLAGFRRFGIAGRGLRRHQAGRHRPRRHDAIRPDLVRGAYTLRVFG